MASGTVVSTETAHALGLATGVVTSREARGAQVRRVGTTRKGKTARTLRPLQRHEIPHMPLKFLPSGVVQKTRRVVCYGDSLTAGFCSLGTLFEPYARTMAKELDASGVPCEILVSGHSGTTAEEMVTAIDTSVVDMAGLQGKGLARMLDDDVLPDLVIIMTGTNDMGRGSTLETIVKDIAHLHTACHRRGVPTVALVPPPAPCAPQQREKDRMRLRHLITEWAMGQKGVKAVLDPAQWVGLDAGSWAWDSDGLHFCPNGSALLGHGLAACVVKLLSNTRCVEDRSASPLATAAAEAKMRPLVPAMTAQMSSAQALPTRQRIDCRPGHTLRSAVACRASGKRLSCMPVAGVAVICA